MAEDTIPQTRLVCDIPEAPMRTCSVEGCIRRKDAKGMCGMHYMRAKTGRPIGGNEPLRTVKGAYARRECLVDGCNSPVHGKGYCSLHYDRHRRGRPFDAPMRVRVPNKGKRCSVDGCDEPAKSLGYCSMHYFRHQEGRPIGGPERLVSRKGDRKVCCVPDCQRYAKCFGRCELHHDRWRKGQPLDAPIRGASPTRSLDENGYVDIEVPKGTPGAFQKGPNRRNWLMAEHRYVMQQELGRPLLKHEHVHHVNGRRDDNRIGNLELWSSRQPKGQRVADKVAYAIEMLTIYPQFVGLDLVDQASLKTILEKVQDIGERSATRIRAKRAALGS